MLSYFSRGKSDYEIETTAAWRDKIAVPIAMVIQFLLSLRFEIWFTSRQDLI